VIGPLAGLRAELRHQLLVAGILGAPDLSTLTVLPAQAARHFGERFISRGH
jgi:hypothetical protein